VQSPAKLLKEVKQRGTFCTFNVHNILFMTIYFGRVTMRPGMYLTRMFFSVIILPSDNASPYDPSRGGLIFFFIGTVEAHMHWSRFRVRMRE
jgi:hypothetical protein